MTATDVSYNARATLTVRVELIRQLRRRRTLVAFVLAVALPLIVVAAVKLGPDARAFGDGDLDLVGLATAGPWNFTLTMLLFASGFLLTIIAAMFLGDTVASEASWSTMRYLLAAPVPRRRFLRSKVIVGLILTAVTLLILVATAFVVALFVFGSAPLTSPLGGSFDVATSWQRLGIVTAYIGIQLLIPAGIAFLMSVLTDVPLGAVGAAVLIVIILNIIDAIDALGDLRRLLPTDYGAAWVDALGQQVVWNDMAIGVSYAVVTFAVLVGIAVLRFDRKDVLS
ncbi:MAG: ABC transporter permease [Candidatus Nanopelagicales bacterium]|jgi:ABC-2 type transport system permease protein|nr:ABC transporter permease [Candidatus Nanopelagicales bacterium]MDP4715255.1 ABC transporter permease [Candidatus Nanopelagicales bacterium]MDP4906259.1 ABC transporter permease [Candidatus Nanopelagicales bacterium]MDP4975462.1 ABC transporter permease [Candidatus Nanopelagicales bacterium]